VIRGDTSAGVPRQARQVGSRAPARIGSRFPQRPAVDTMPARRPRRRRAGRGVRSPNRLSARMAS